MSLALYEHLFKLTYADARLPKARLDDAIRHLHEAFPRHQWTGIYVVKGDMLELSSFAGPETEHRRIPVGKGMCGKAVAEKRDLDIGDVAQADGYLACSLSTRAEAIALIWRHGEIIGQIDVDSDQGGEFGGAAMTQLRACAELLAPLVAQV